MKSKFSLTNLPSLNDAGFIIEQDFLRHQKEGEIPNLEAYLSKLNEYDWAGLLANNPREEFVALLTDEMMRKINWKYVLGNILRYKKAYL